MLYMLTVRFIVKLFNLLFFVSFATGYIHSGEIKIFNAPRKTVRYADHILVYTIF